MGCQFITLSYHPLPLSLCQPELLQGSRAWQDERVVQGRAPQCLSLSGWRVHPPWWPLHPQPRLLSLVVQTS